MNKQIRAAALIMGLILLAGCGENAAADARAAETDAVQPAGMTQAPEKADPVTAADGMAEAAGETAAENGAIDVDLTVMSSTMVYSQVYNMMLRPDEFTGKTIKMDGIFSFYHDDQTGKDYYACIVQDATACCAQGIEFELAGEHVYPDDYPENGGYICVAGEFDTYHEGGYTYGILRNARLEDA